MITSLLNNMFYLVTLLVSLLDYNVEYNSWYRNKKQKLQHKHVELSWCLPALEHQNWYFQWDNGSYPDLEISRHFFTLMGPNVYQPIFR